MGRRESHGGAANGAASPACRNDVFNDTAMLITFLVSAGSSYVGMLAATEFAQPLEMAVPLVLSMVAVLLVSHAPAAACCLMPLAMIFSAFYIDNPGIAVWLVSMSGVAALRVFAYAHNERLRGGFGTMCCVLVTIPNLDSAVRRRRSVGRIIASALLRVFVCGAAGYAVFRAAGLLFGKAYLQSSVFVSSAVMGLMATAALYALDGMYAMLYAYPAGIEFAHPIQRHPLLARTVQEFWNNRWNTSISRALRSGVYSPLHASLGLPKRTAALGAFLASAVLHTAQFVAWRASWQMCASVILFFISQWVVVQLERRALKVSSWSSPMCQRLWTLAALLLTGPLLCLPLVAVNDTWGHL